MQKKKKKKKKIKTEKCQARMISCCVNPKIQFLQRNLRIYN